MRNNYFKLPVLNLPKSCVQLLVTLALALLSLNIQAQSNLANGLKAYWNFDGNFLDSIKNFHGTPRGTNPVVFVDGKTNFGKAIKLDGTDQFVEITGGNENDLEFPGGSMSIAGWFKVDAFDTDWQALIAKGEGSHYRVARRASTNSIAYAGGVGEGADDVPNVNDGQWHHFVAITDAVTNRFGTALYVDGVRRGVNAAKPVLTANTNRLMIGENPEARGRACEGLIDDIAIWNRVLTTNEINSLYAGGAGRPLNAFFPDTLMVFNFDEGTGTNVTSADGRLVGTFVGTPRFTNDTPSGMAGDFSMQFAAGQRVSVPDPTKVLALDPSNPSFTIEAWLKFATPAARAVYFYNNAPAESVWPDRFRISPPFLPLVSLRHRRTPRP